MLGRKSGDSTQRGGVSGVELSNGDHPQSTIAAQIVNNHSRANETREPQNNALFGQLLQEFLTDQSPMDDNVELNLQLVSVVVEAGFNALLRDNPFGQDVLLSQAKDGISVIRITVERNPSLLFYQDEEHPDSTTKPPLVAWLLPKLFTLLSRHSLKSLHADLRALLSYFIKVTSKGKETWELATLLFETYQACIDGVISAFENQASSRPSTPSFKLILPPPNAVSRLLTDGPQLVVLPQNCQTEVHSPLQAICIALALLSPICYHLDPSLSTCLAGALCPSMQDWAADRYNYLWDCSTRLKLLQKSREDQVDQLLLSFLLISKYLAPCVATRLPGSNPSLKASTTFYQTLAEITEQVCQLPGSSGVQRELSHVLLNTLWLYRRGSLDRSLGSSSDELLDGLFGEVLLPALESAVQDRSESVNVSDDLKSAIALCITRHEVKAGCTGDSQASFQPRWVRDVHSLDDTQLLGKFSELLLDTQQDEFPDEERPRKRQRVDETIQTPRIKSSYAHLVAKITKYFSGNSRDSIDGIHSTAKVRFDALSDEDRCDALTAFMRLPCAAVGTLVANVHSNGDIAEMSCTICDGHAKASSDTAFWNDDKFGPSWKEAIKITETIIQSEQLQKTKGPRVLVATTIRSLVSHINDCEALNLRKSRLAQWCLKHFTSTTRELRIASGFALPAFLHNEVPEDVRQKNRLYALDFMKELEGRNVLGEHETLILTWGQVARACGEDELNIALLQLVRYLGHSHPFICGVAYNELSSLPESLGCKPMELLKPFWRSIGFEVFKDLSSRPQKAQQLSDFLEMSVNQLLLLTQHETLPYLVLMKKKDVIQRIATARGTTVQNVCLQPRRNLASIVALLLVQSNGDIEISAAALLCESVPGFAEEDLSTMIQTEPVLIASEILKAAAQETGERKKKIHQVFHIFAALAERRTGPTARSTSSKGSKALVQFFDNNILGIMAQFSEMIDNSKGQQPVSERNICLGAIEELIVLAGKHVSFALPQIRACLQSAFDVPQLCDKSFSAWSLLLNVVDEEDIEPLVDQTFSVVVQCWPSFGPDIQHKAHATIMELVKKHNSLLQERIGMLPSLKSIPILSKIDAEISRFRDKPSVNQYEAFTKRCRDENASVVAQALKELIPFLETHQQFIHETTVSQRPSPVVAQLCRSILDASVRFTESHPEISVLSAQCLGLVGCLDPSRTETVRPRREMLVLSNFDRADEAIEFVAFMLETVLVKVFQSATNAKSQAFISYAMQEMLKFCGFNVEATTYRPRSSQGSPSYQRWMEIPENVRSTLTPFLNSKFEYRNNAGTTQELQTYPIFSPGIGHAAWLRSFVWDLLQRPKGGNAKMIFPVLSRIIRGYDLSIATFLLPFAIVNVILGATEQEFENISRELLMILEYEIEGSGPEADSAKQCSEVLDYMSKWLQEKRRQLNEARVLATRSGRGLSELDEVTAVSQISNIEGVLHSIPAEIISRRAVDCGSYARALFHWEQYVRQRKEQAELSNDKFDQESLYQHLQHIYTQIDEPDSIEGISAHLQILDPDQQVLEHRKAGRWTAAQSWYELSLAEKPDDTEIQYQLVNCLKESGQYDSLLAQAESFKRSIGTCAPKVLSLAAEASWVTGKWRILEDLLADAPTDVQEFNVGLGKAFLSLRREEPQDFAAKISELREGIARGLSASNTASLQACHDNLLKLHVLYEAAAISGVADASVLSQQDLIKNLNRRLDVLGAYTADKQYVLGLRRAAMQLSSRGFTKQDLASTWLTTSRLARKVNQTNIAFDAVLHATRLGENEAKIEHSRLLWKDGHHRKAIQNLEGAMAANVFRSNDQAPADLADSMATNEEQMQLQNKLSAKAYILKGKWLDESGQSSSAHIIRCYHSAINTYGRMEKAHYYLGKHYNKLLESERSQQKISFSCKCGDHARLVIENYLRGVVWGTKHLFETIPKVLTLWLDLAMEVQRDPPPRDWDKNQQRYEREESIPAVRAGRLNIINNQIKKYAIDGARLPAYIFYTALPQMITRISHPHQATFDLLARLIIKVALAHPQQALWSLLAVVKSTNQERSSRGLTLLTKLRELGKKTKSDSPTVPDIKTLISQGQKLSEGLLHACDKEVHPKAVRVSLSQDLKFSHKLAPCSLVVPIEATLQTSLPSNTEATSRHHRAFSGNVITISSFSDDVLVLSSLQRPRKVTVRGSDGRLYGLLCKPKDDLRKDQRLMEFNSMVNRTLLGDTESSKRRLDIRTYAVTPLNEECGAAEWVEGLKPMRDIMLKFYKEHNVRIDYAEIRTKLNEACKDRGSVGIFTDEIIKQFRPVLHEWFIETFPEPEAWLAARLKYTRSCAVMSMVGHVLGLGDRHGENVLLIEDDGRVFHVDFNCLFDKGLTFEKPELVPFRLTHNMVDAMGAHGVEGPYRLAAELTLRQLRQHIDTLMTILETFLYDPTADFIGKKKRQIRNVPSTPEEVLESVKKKVKGFLPGETVPLSVEGYVDALILKATDPLNLASMYIGWCAFF